MIPEDKIGEFVKRARDAAGSNLESVILYGSAAGGDYDPEFSDVNLFCLLRDSSFASLETLSPVAKWWEKQKQPPALVMTRAELERSTDVFTIELLDMQQHHRVLYGNDVLQGLPVSMHLHRVQVEYELREKLVLLRQKMVLCCESENQLWDLMLRSVASFVTLFRHAAIALVVPAQNGKHSAVESLSKVIQFDCSAIEQLLAVRKKKADRKDIDVRDLAKRYLAAIEHVTDAVDRKMESGTLGHS
jgi:predicted nucleotidyltransferase